MTITCEDLSIKVLVDDKGCCGLVGEKGFAAWIGLPDREILFDTGQGKGLLPNAAELGCNLSQLVALVLSHGHYDHSGAVSAVLAGAPSCRLYCHASACVPRYSAQSGEAARSIAVATADREAILALPPERIKWVDDPQQVAGDVWLSGPIPRWHPLEDTGGPFFLDPDGRRADPLDDDLAIGITTDRGLVIVTGCCHAGLINTVGLLRFATGVDTIFGILGGLHLMNASRARLDATCAALRQWRPAFVIPCHCTGDDAVTALQEQLGASVVPGYAGLTLSFAGGGITVT